MAIGHTFFSEEEMIKICEWCGKEYEPLFTDWDNKQKYCSTKCKRAHDYRVWKERHPYEYKPIRKIFNCVICGTPLVKNQVKYCSDCRKKTARMTTHMDDIMKCGICGKEFKRKSPCQKYCSPECMKIGVNKKSMESYHKHKAEIIAKKRAVKSEPDRRCKVCGKKLNRRQLYYCSMECRRSDRTDGVKHYTGYVPNVCFVCGEEIPSKKNPENDYVIHEHCLDKTSFKIDDKRVYRG